jgi:hypothetical protein
MLFKGITYQDGTDQALVEAITARIQEFNFWTGSGGKPERIRVRYGDKHTGRDWEEEYGCTGYIGTSLGYTTKIPILCYNSRSLGGGALLVDCIVSLEWAQAGRPPIWRHPFYHKQGEARVRMVLARVKACEYDHINQEEKFVVFSDTNPEAKKLDKWVRIHWEEDWGIKQDWEEYDNEYNSVKV